MTNSRQLWVEAGCILSENPKAKVVCPECGKMPLNVKDVRFGANGAFIERHLRCPQCGARNSLRLHRPRKKENHGN